MVRSTALVAWCAASGIEVCLAEAVRQQDVDVDALSLLQKKAVVSRRAQEEAHSQTDIENEWGLGDMLSSVVEAVHGAFQNEPDPADKFALQLMEANKTVVTANNTALGVLHLVHGCHQCGFHFCDKASVKESKAGIEDSYLVGTAVSEWGCDKVADPYVVHDKRTRKVYAVEFLETKPQEAHASKEEASEAKASKTEVNHSAKSQVKKESHSESQHKAVHKNTEATTARKKATDTKAKQSVAAAGADSTSKHQWPDFSLPHLEATDKIKEKISSMASVHAHSEDADKHSKATSKEKAKTEKAEEETAVKSVKSEEPAPKAKQHAHDSSFMEHGVAVTEKEDFPDLKIPHVIQKAVETTEKKISSTLSADKKVEIKEKSTTHTKGSKLAADSKESAEEKKHEHASADSLKSDKHDSSFVEHGVAVIEKEDFPELKIPHVIQKAVETTEKKISSKFSADKKVEIKEKSTTHTKVSKLAANSTKSAEEKKHEHASAESLKSDKHDAKASQHPHDSSLMEHGVAVAEKEDFPNLNIPHVFHKAVSATEDKLSSKVSADKKSEIKSKSTAHVKESKLASGTKEEKKGSHSSAKKVKPDKSDVGEKAKHSHSTSTGK